MGCLLPPVLLVAYVEKVVKVRGLEVDLVEAGCREGIEAPVARVAGGKHAVKDAPAGQVAADDMLRLAHAEGESGQGIGGTLRSVGQDLVGQLAIWSERPAAKAKSIKAQGQQGLGAPGAFLPVVATLDNAKEQGPGSRPRSLALTPDLDLPVELDAAALRPVDGPFDSHFHLLRRGVGAGAIVEADHQVGAEVELQPDAALRCEQASSCGCRPDR